MEPSIVFSRRLPMPPPRGQPGAAHAPHVPFDWSAGVPGLAADIVSGHRFVKRGDMLFESGADFASIYAIRSGFFKTVVHGPGGRAQVTGFHMAGDLLGLDAIDAGRHTTSATALEDSQACVIPFAALQQRCCNAPELQHCVHQAMGREIVRDQDMMLLLGGMRAEQRLAAFLINLSQRLQSRGYAPAEMVLRMTREEIGSYLGMTLETVSRTFSKLRAEGIVDVDLREIHLRRVESLRQRATETC